MFKFELEERERQVLQVLARGGAMSPSQVSAETLILPGDTVKLLQMLADVGLVLMRDDSDSADGKLVVLSAQAKELLNMNNLAQMQMQMQMQVKR